MEYLADALPNDFDSYENYALEMAEFLNQYQFLFRDLHLTRFLCHDTWNNRVPVEWREALKDEPLDVLVKLNQGFYKNNWPSSLKYMIQQAQKLNLRRQPTSSLQQEEEKSPSSASSTPLSSSSLNHLHSDKKELLRGMSPKKRHEVGILARVINSVADACGCRVIMDIGAGQGYLSHVLAYDYEKIVVGVDNDPHQSQGFEYRRNSFLSRQKDLNPSLTKNDEPSDFNSKKKNSNSGSFSVTSHLSLDLSSDDLDRILSPYASTIKNENNESPLIVGLHTCGDLAATMIRVFRNSQHFAGMINVGCCYHKITEFNEMNNDNSKNALNNNNANQSKHNLDVGYPLSKFFKKLNVKLGKSGLMLSCQPIAKWTPENSAPQFKRHAFRAALELFLAKNISHFNGSESIKIGHIPKSALSSFSNYAIRSIQKGKINDSPLHQNLDRKYDNDELESFYQQLNPELLEKSISIFWSLRSVLAPVIESFLLVDRLLYLKENPTSQSKLVPIFTEHQSPRGIMLFSLNDLQIQ